MFRFPIPVPRRTAYARLGISPEADKATVNRALNAARARIERDKAALLAEADAAGDAAPVELQRRVDALSDELLELNGLDLDRTEGREKYDEEHPPFGLLKLQAGEDPLFEDQRATLHVLRRELCDWIEARGEHVTHPTDLTRRDFRGDFTYHPALDGGDE